jgi:hypothetical protein
MKDELLALEARKAELGRELASPLLRWLSLTSRRSVDNDPKNWRAQPPPKPDPGTYIQVAFRLSRISADGARLQNKLEYFREPATRSCGGSSRRPHLPAPSEVHHRPCASRDTFSILFPYESTSNFERRANQLILLVSPRGFEPLLPP